MKPHSTSSENISKGWSSSWASLATWIGTLKTRYKNMEVLSMIPCKQSTLWISVRFNSLSMLIKFKSEPISYTSNYTCSRNLCKDWWSGSEVKSLRWSDSNKWMTIYKKWSNILSHRDASSIIFKKDGQSLWERFHHYLWAWKYNLWHSPNSLITVTNSLAMKFIDSRAARIKEYKNNS